MDDTSINTRVLKMQKPPTAIHRIHQRPLMRSVDSRFTLSENNFIFVRTVNVFGTQGHLPASFHTTSRSQYVIPAIAFEKLWPLDGRMPFRFVKNNLAFPQQTACIPGHGDRKCVWNARPLASQFPHHQQEPVCNTSHRV